MGKERDAKINECVLWQEGARGKSSQSLHGKQERLANQMTSSKLDGWREQF